EPSGHDESSSLYAELGLTKSDTESDEEVPPIVKSGAPNEGQARPNPGTQDEGQAGPNPDWDTSAQRSESSSSTTSSFDLEIVALKAEMAEINKNLMKMLQTNQQVKA
ncbi:hypothetical protein Tco_0220707, partial [Tanacetum coccineum]